jgi:hypothetical protein
MTDWRPKPNTNIDPGRVQLTSEEGFVLSRLDGETTIGILTQLTGLSTDRIHVIMNRLMDEGAVSEDDLPDSFDRVHVDRPPMSQNPPASKPPLPPTGEQESNPDEASHPHHPPDNDNTNDNDDYDDDDDDYDYDYDYDDDDDDDDDDDYDYDDDDDDSEEGADEAEVIEPDREDEKATIDLRNFYKTNLQHLPLKERGDLASSGSGETLMALCLEKDPSVCRRLFDNRNFDMRHARLIAKHQKSTTTLDVLVRHARFLRDIQVQSHLFRNPMLSETMFHRIVKSKRMAGLYRLAISQEATERVRRSAKNMLRTRFQYGSPEERIDLFFKTEGRCLLMIAGIGIDGRTAQLMCTRSYHSRILVQNLAKWPPLPTRVITHLVKQPAVRRQATIRNALLSHPNTSRQLKAQFKSKSSA